VERVTLRRGDIEADILSFGAVIQDLRVCGRSVVLGFDTFDPYPDHSPYFGAIVGRCANRIAGSCFALDGREHRLVPNEAGFHHLHGGPDGFSSRSWTIEAADAHSVLLSLRSAHGDQGYPGAVRVTCRYTLVGDLGLRIQLDGETDMPTLLNLAPHSYFNLDGAKDVSAHRLRVDAGEYLPVDADLIPTGEIRPVAGTRFDFRQLRVVGARKANEPLDHNFCLSRAPVSRPRKVARLEAGDGSIALDLATTAPGLQVYDGAKLDVHPAGHGGKTYGPCAGLCLEPQFWPDAINHEGFAGCVLRPGEAWRQVTDYEFSVGS
jgi:aldose 1-epimerase